MQIILEKKVLNRSKIAYINIVALAWSAIVMFKTWPLSSIISISAPALGGEVQVCATAP